jgi:aryl-alcohol dehydrogenase-like predicted oxidoreductase
LTRRSPSSRGARWARGRLTRASNETSERQESDAFGRNLYQQTFASDQKIVDAVGVIAERRKVPRAQVALAWVLQKSAIIAPIVGMSKPHHLDDALAALSLQLLPTEIEAVETPYVPHQIVGFQ